MVMFDLTFCIVTGKIVAEILPSEGNLEFVVTSVSLRISLE